MSLGTNDLWKDQNKTNSLNGTGTSRKLKKHHVHFKRVGHFVPTNGVIEGKPLKI